MKTVVIWDDMMGEIKFGIFDEDLSHLNNLYVNSGDLSDDDEEKISSLSCELTEFPVEAVKEGAKVIVCGFLP